MFKNIAVATLSLFISTQTLVAKEITVINTAKRGGLTALWNDSVQDILSQEGYEVKRINYTNCVEAYNWYERNKDKSFIAVLYSNFYLSGFMEDNLGLSCTFPMEKENLVSIATKSWMFICGRGEEKSKESMLDDFLNNSDNKLAINKEPVSEKIIASGIRDIGYSGRFVPFVSYGEALTAFKTKDIDYIMASTESTVSSLDDLNCFLSLADSENKKFHSFDSISIEELDADNNIINFGNWPLLFGNNIDSDKLRDVFEVTDNELYKRVSASGFIDSDSTHDRDVKEIKSLAEKAKNM